VSEGKKKGGFTNLYRLLESFLLLIFKERKKALYLRTEWDGRDYSSIYRRRGEEKGGNYLLQGGGLAPTSPGEKEGRSQMISDKDKISTSSLFLPPGDWRKRGKGGASFSFCEIVGGPAI